MSDRIKLAEGSTPTIVTEKYIHLDAINVLYFQIGCRCGINDEIFLTESYIKADKSEKKQPSKVLTEKLAGLEKKKENMLKSIEVLKSFGKVGDKVVTDSEKLSIFNSLTKNLNIDSITQMHAGCYAIKAKNHKEHPYYHLKIERNFNEATLD